MARQLERGSTAGVIGRSSNADPQDGDRRTEVIASSASGPAVRGPAKSPPRGPDPGRPPSVPSPSGPGTSPSGPGTSPSGPGRRSRPRRSAGERVLRGLVVLLAVVLVIAGGAYGYLRYRLGQIKSIQCPNCAAVAAGAPYNVLIVGSDSRAGDTGTTAQEFGSSAEVAGQRSDTIKIVHVDPAAGTATLMSIPRDTYVDLSGMPSGTGLSTENKINTAFNDGPTPLIQTIEDTFGIPISHFVVIDFSGVINLVNAVGGINLNFPYPVRDNDNGNNNSGLNITHAGCQTLNGTMALALARSRYYEYENSPGYWEYDGSGDLGRIQRQNAIIEAVIDKAKSTYNPLTLNAFIGSLVHDITVDSGMSSGTMIDLAERYHAFSGSSLHTLTLPTYGGYSSSAGDVEVVQEPQAQQAISQFLGTQPGVVTTPPLDQYGSPLAVPTTVSGSAPSSGSGSGSSATGSSGTSGSSSAPAPGTGTFNPTPC